MYEYMYIAIFLVLIGYVLAILWDGYAIRKKTNENIKRTEGILKRKISEIKSRGEK